MEMNDDVKEMNTEIPGTIVVSDGHYEYIVFIRHITMINPLRSVGALHTVIHTVGTSISVVQYVDDVKKMIKDAIPPAY